MSKQRTRRYINREMSWLAFNERVLEEAEDSTVPLLTRLSFLAIFSSNLDEFVMVRVGGLSQAVRRGVTRSGPAGMIPREQLDNVLARMHQLVGRQYKSFSEDVWPALVDQAGLRRLSASDMDLAQQTHVAELFENEIFPLLTPLAVDEAREFSRVPELTQNVLVRLAERDKPDAPLREAVVPIPSQLSRVVLAPSADGHCFWLIEDIVMMYLGRLFEGYDIRETALFRITRDADMSVEESQDEDFLSAMTDVLIQRRESPVVRLELAEAATQWARDYLADLFGVNESETFVISGPMDLKAFWTFVGMEGLSHLRYPQFQPQPSPDLPAEGPLWDAIREKDILLHHPYESFDAVVRLMRTAAEDPAVLAIKQVLYRTSGDSPVVAALEQAALAGKQVSVLVELKARFDEARNIGWARRLERAGAQVVYGLSGLKVHSKALMIVRRDSDRIRRYVHLGTGNYNDVTARIYTDLGLLTCDENFGVDVAGFFNMVTGYSQPTDWRKISVAPLGIRPKLLHLIERESQRAEAGQTALIMAKMNSLSDPEMIEALCDASRAGVKIHLNVRGICCLRPGLKGISENIEVVSIVDRFLEHSRIFYFRNGGEEEVYCGSADLMTRNLDKRVEIMFPVESPPLKRRLIEALEIFLRDNVKGRRLTRTGEWERPEQARRKNQAQETFMKLAEDATRKMSERAQREFHVIRPPDEASA